MCNPRWCSNLSQCVPASKHGASLCRALPGMVDSTGAGSSSASEQQEVPLTPLRDDVREATLASSMTSTPEWAEGSPIDRLLPDDPTQGLDASPSAWQHGDADQSPVNWPLQRPHQVKSASSADNGTSRSAAGKQSASEKANQMHEAAMSRQQQQQQKVEERAKAAAALAAASPANKTDNVRRQREQQQQQQPQQPAEAAETAESATVTMVEQQEDEAVPSKHADKASEEPLSKHKRKKAKKVRRKGLPRKAKHSRLSAGNSPGSSPSSSP